MAKKRPTRRRRLRKMTWKERQREADQITTDHDQVMEQFYSDLLNIPTDQGEEQWIADYRKIEALADRRLDSLMARMRRIIPEDIRHPIDIDETAERLNITPEDVRKGMKEALKADMYAIETDDKGNQFIVHYSKGRYDEPE